jgi:hypothetical protein
LRIVARRSIQCWPNKLKTKLLWRLPDEQNLIPTNEPTSLPPLIIAKNSMIKNKTKEIKNFFHGIRWLSYLIRSSWRILIIRKYMLNTFIPHWDNESSLQDRHHRYHQAIWDQSNYPLISSWRFLCLNRSLFLLSYLLVSRDEECCQLYCYQYDNLLSWASLSHREEYASMLGTYHNRSRR